MGCSSTEPSTNAVQWGEGAFLTVIFSSQDFLQGDCTKARQKLNWKPRVTFDELVREMVDADVELMRSNPNA